MFQKIIFIFIFILFFVINGFSQSQEDKIFKIGIDYFNAHKYQFAKRYLDRYIFLFPEGKNSIKCYEILIKISLINKNYLKAIKYLNTVIKLFPSEINIPSYYNKIADVYFQTGKYEKSLQYYNYVIIKFPNTPEAEYAQFKIDQISLLTSSINNEDD